MLAVPLETQATNEYPKHGCLGERRVEQYRLSLRLGC